MEPPTVNPLNWSVWHGVPSTKQVATVPASGAGSVTGEAVELASPVSAPGTGVELASVVGTEGAVVEEVLSGLSVVVANATAVRFLSMKDAYALKRVATVGDTARKLLGALPVSAGGAGVVSVDGVSGGAVGVAFSAGGAGEIGVTTGKTTGGVASVPLPVLVFASDDEASVGADGATFVVDEPVSGVDVETGGAAGGVTI